MACSQISWTTSSASTPTATPTRSLSSPLRQTRSCSRRRSAPIGAATTARSPLPSNTRPATACDDRGERQLRRGPRPLPRRVRRTRPRGRAAAASDRRQGKSDRIDALRAAHAALGEAKLAPPRSGRAREALRALVTTREGTRMLSLCGSSCERWAARLGASVKSSTDWNAPSTGSRLRETSRSAALDQ
jgi:hypothetical protein